MTILQDTSQELAALVKSAAAGVVRVEARRWTPASGIVWSADGVVVTANHVIDEDASIEIGLIDGKVTGATLVGRDPSTDIAVLRLTDSQAAASLQVLPRAGSEDPAVGQLTLAVGFPGEALQVSLGAVSAVEGAWRTPAGGRVDRYIRPEINMYPGFSGGPLLSSGGQVLGMNTSGLLRNEGITLPVETLQRVVEAILAHGHVRRVRLGVGSQVVRLPVSLDGQDTGLLISSIEADSAAEKGGLLVGDILVKMGEQPIRHLDDLLFFLNADRAGETVQANLVRGGEVQTRPIAF